MSASSPFVKICCISTVAEAELAISLGASALGLVSRMPSGPGVISEETISKIAAAVGDRVETVLLTSESDPATIAAQVTDCGVSGVQLCTWLDDDARKALRGMLPSTMLMQVVHVVDASAFERALSAQRFLDRLLLDSGSPSGPIKELGGTGRTHDWQVSRRIVETVEVPVLLAGGLRGDNVRAAHGEVGPFGLDVCSGVRLNGNLDPARLTSFFDALKVERLMATCRDSTDAY
ncbi:MAG TPA: phosphoribosylanthranilate isomerase [Rhodothermales bacterium]|nr:phosphoribosylanthranilate isomerase [Rhodothermales bacterium]